MLSFTNREKTGSSVTSRGAGGQSAPSDSEKIAKNRAKEGKIGKKRKKIREKREKIG